MFPSDIGLFWLRNGDAAKNSYLAILIIPRIFTNSMKRTYWICFLISLAIVFYIGFFTTGFIRIYIGDVIIIPVLYFLYRAIFTTTIFRAALVIFLFAVAVETAQYFNIVDLLGLTENRAAAIIIGTSFSWGDILAYLAGIIISVVVDLVLHQKFKILRRL